MPDRHSIRIKRCANFIPSASPYSQKTLAQGLQFALFTNGSQSTLLSEPARSVHLRCGHSKSGTIEVASSYIVPLWIRADDFVPIIEL